MWNSLGRSGYGNTNLDGTYDDAILGISPNGRQYRNEATLETRDLSGWAYWNLRKKITPEQEIPEELYARNETESMSHTLANGQANLLKYADKVVPVKKSSISIEDRILPQAKRVRVLTEQLYELEAERKNGMDLTTYSQLRDVLICKRDRAEVLLKKALSTKPIRPEISEDEEEIHYSSSSTPSDNNRHRESYSSPVGGGATSVARFFAEVVDGLSETNSLKSFLKFSCKAISKAIHFKHKAARYLNELKEV